MRVKVSPVYWSIQMLSVNSLALSFGWSGVVRNKDPDSRECKLAKFFSPCIQLILNKFDCISCQLRQVAMVQWPQWVVTRAFRPMVCPVVWAAAWRAVHLAAWLQVHFLMFAAVTLSHDFLTLGIPGWVKIMMDLSSCFKVAFFAATHKH